MKSIKMILNLVWGPVVMLLLFSAPAASAGSQSVSGPGYSIEMSRMIPMRDGVQLEAWISKPDNLKAKAPTVLELTQYDIDGGRHRDFDAFVKRGFVFVQAYVRGRGKSGGVKTDNLGLQVGRDGYDLVEWIARQPWSDGRVVMYGGSFVGMTQWRTAAQRPPHLAGIAPYVPIYPGWDIPNTNGIPQAWTAVILGIIAGRSYNEGFVGNQDYWMGKMLEQYAAYRPFTELYSAIGIEPGDWLMLDEHGQKKPMINVWLDHVGDDAFNLAAEPKATDFRQMTFPVLTATGFFDDDQPGTLRYYRRYMASAPAMALENTYLVIGPWDHGGTQNPASEIMGLRIPQAAVIDMNKLHADWYDWILGRGPRPAFLRDKVNYFMLGAGEWRSANSLEAASSGKSLELFLSAPQGTPKDVFHSGSLIERPSPLEPPANIVSDPHELPDLEFAKYLSDESLTSEFRDYQKRAIVFHSEPFPHDVEVAGQMKLRLVVQSDAPDFDLWAQVLMVQPDGSTVRLGEDVRRARFRDSVFKQELLTPGQIVTIPFEFFWMARRIPAGARLRVTIAPFNSAMYQKNYNTGGRIGYEKIEDARVAHIQLFHDSQHASVLELPLAAPSEANAR